MSDDFRWAPLAPADLDSVNRIADLVHTTLPERPEVFEEKVTLFPKGCRKFVCEERILGYGISHPWTLHSIPPLDTFLERLPSNPDCLYIHDVVVMPEARGRGAAARYVDYIKAIAADSGIWSLALVSVYGTDVLWSRYGFRVVLGSALDDKVASYGASARYMICDVR